MVIEGKTGGGTPIMMLIEGMTSSRAPIDTGAVRRFDESMTTRTTTGGATVDTCTVLGRQGDDSLTLRTTTTGGATVETCTVPGRQGDDCLTLRTTTPGGATVETYAVRSHRGDMGVRCSAAATTTTVAAPTRATCEPPVVPRHRDGNKYSGESR